MKLADFRHEIAVHNLAHPELPQCIAYHCQNKINPTWDNRVMCKEHQLIMEYWFYEEDGAKYCPETWDNIGDFDDPKKMLPKPKGSDENMAAYRKRYCDWMAALPTQEYLTILKHQIGDDEKP